VYSCEENEFDQKDLANESKAHSGAFAQSSAAPTIMTNLCNRSDIAF
jgi:hypothetical protein